MPHSEATDAAFLQTSRTQVKRLPQRGEYDRQLMETLVLALPLTDASAKMQSGVPVVFESRGNSAAIVGE